MGSSYADWEAQIRWSRSKSRRTFCENFFGAAQEMSAATGITTVLGGALVGFGAGATVVASKIITGRLNESVVAAAEATASVGAVGLLATAGASAVTCAISYLNRDDTIRADNRSVSNLGLAFGLAVPLACGVAVGTYQYNQLDAPVMSAKTVAPAPTNYNRDVVADEIRKLETQTGCTVTLTCKP